MSEFLVVVSGRADASPLKPVIHELGANVCDLSGVPLSGCISAVERHLPCGVMVLLGDRYETLAAATAATMARIPIAHIHGGEASFGSFDNQIRDAVTKLAHIHFAATNKAAVRLRDLGEESKRIHIVGAPGLDNLPEPRVRSNYLVVTYHPPTLGDVRGVHALLSGLEKFKGRVYWTGSNQDPGARYIEDAVDEWRGAMRVNWDLGQYLDVVSEAGAVVGNSSAGIIECPALRVPSVDVGPRQEGRVRGPSVFTVPEEPEAIEAAVDAALEYEGPWLNPHGERGASRKIAAILRSEKIDMVKRWSL